MKESNALQMRGLLISQNLILFGSGMVFPFYVIFIKEVGANFTQSWYKFYRQLVHILTKVDTNFNES